MKTTVHGGLTRLRRGHVIDFGGEEYVVLMVNDCRALCRPLGKVKKVIVDDDGGVKASFSAPGEGVSISPNSECNILRILPEATLIARFPKNPPR